MARPLGERDTRTGTTRTTSTATSPRSRPRPSTTCATSSRSTTRRTTRCSWWSATWTPRRSRKLVEKYFADIPTGATPARPGRDRAAANEGEEGLPDGQAREPACTRHRLAPARSDLTRLPGHGRCSTDPAGRRVLAPLPEAGQGEGDLAGLDGRDQPYLGNEFDYNGPMLLTTRTTYKPGPHRGRYPQGGRRRRRRRPGAGESRPRSWRTPRCASGPRITTSSNREFGKANLIAAFTLFRGDPHLINTALQAFESVTPAQAQAAAKKYLVATNRTVIDRVPEPKAEGAAKGGR